MAPRYPPDRLERLADAALYLAKRDGRNRVELAEPGIAEFTPGLPWPPLASANGSGRASLPSTVSGP